MALSFKLTKANYDALRSMSMTQRVQVAKNDEVGQWLLSLLSPTQLAELFPLYYQKMLPADISGFTKAMPTAMTMAKQQAIEEQLQNTVTGAAAGANMQAGGWRKKYQESITAKIGKTPPQLTEEQSKIYSELKSTPMSIDDPRAKMFAGLDEQQLASVGVKRITQDGKDFFKYSAPTVSDEEVKRSLSVTDQAKSITRVADKLGIPPNDLAAVMHYESAGSMSTSKWGGTGGNYVGLIQFGPNERNKYGAYAGQPFDEQVSAAGRFLEDRGLKRWLDSHPNATQEEKRIALYSTINAGNPNESNWHKSDNGGKDNVISHTQRIFREHYGAASAFMGQQGSVTNDYSDRAMEIARERLIRNMEANRIGTLAEYTNAGIPAPGSPQASAIVGDTKGANAVAQKIKDQFANLSNPQCVALAKAYVGASGSVTEWRRGTNVMDGTLKPGTPIATFMDRQGNPSTMYDGGQGVGAPGNHTTHAAVFLDYQRDGAGKITGIRVMEQYKGSNGAHERTYPVGGFGTNNAANYHSINDKSGAPLGSTNPMVQNAAVDPPKTPLADYTSKQQQAPAVAPPKPVEAKPDNKDNTPPPKQVKSNATGGVNKINTEQITAYPIGGAQGDNAVVVNAQQQPLFTMNTNERMLIDPKSDTAQVLPDQKPQLNQQPQQDMAAMMDEFKTTVQELKNQFSQNDPGKFPEPNMTDKETFSKDSAQGHVLDNMNDLSKEWYSTPSMKRAAFRTGGVETGEPVSNFHYSHGNKS